MKEIKTTIYECEHCRKYYKLKRFAILHEPKCRKNPINKQRCYDGCVHLVKKEVTYFWDHFDGSHESKKEILFCNAKQEGVYPFWMNRPLYQEDIEGEIPNEVMPCECDKFSNSI